MKSIKTLTIKVLQEFLCLICDEVINLKEVVWYIGIRLDKSWWTCKYNNPLAWEKMSKNSI